MARQEKTSKSGFVIKLSSETVNKLVEEEQLAKKKNVIIGIPDSTDDVKQVKKDSEVEPVSSTDPQQIESPSSSNDLLNASSEAECKEIEEKPSPERKSPTPESSNAIAGLKKYTSTDWGDYAKFITYDNDVATYTDPETKGQLVWNKDTNAWEAKQQTAVDNSGRVYSYEDDTHVYTEADGTKFFWDNDKKAWIPKLDEEFLAYYQMSYGFVDNSTKDDKKEEKVEKKTEEKLEQAGVKRKKDPQWFEPSQENNTKVYVSNLPGDLNEEEFVNFMQKCGLVERDPKTQKMKVKLYTDKEHDCFKGDALCSYIKVESVDLALKILDGSELKGSTVKVERAHFQLKGEYNPALKPKQKKKKEVEKLKKMQQKLFDWRPEKFVGERSKHERVVIVKNLFHPTDFDKEVQLILDYQQDLREECSKCGEVRKVVMYDRHPEGVAQITMKEPEEADAVIKLINGRWFGKRQITAEIWDGRTKYRIAETDADISKRIDKWDKFLEGEEGKAKENENKAEQSADKTTTGAEEVVKPAEQAAEKMECDKPE